MPRIPLLLLLIGLLLPLAGCQRATPEATSGTPTPSAGEIRLVIDFGDDRQIETVLQDVEPGTTVEALMRRVPEVPIEIAGSGTTAIVQSIDGAAMAGGKGWLYQVDGQWADRGIGQTRVDPGSEIRWRYGKFDTATAGAGAGSKS